MNTSDTFRAPVAIPSLIPRRDEGLTPIGFGMRMMTTHFNLRGPSSNRKPMWYVRPTSREEELTAFTCQRSGYRFPGSYKEIDSDGRMVGRPFWRE